jgi:hypothetical protein
MGGCTGSSVIPRDKRRKSDEQRDCCDLLARVGKGTAVAVSPGRGYILLNRGPRVCSLAGGGDRVRACMGLFLAGLRQDGIV